MLRALTVLSSALLVILFLGCAVSPPLTWEDASVDMVWPAPPDQSRVRYLRSLSGPADFKEKDSSSEMFRWWFGEEQNDASLLNPFAVAVSREGQVWVADSGSRLVYMIDMDHRKVKYFQEFGEFFLGSPSGIAIDDLRQRVYVSDAAGQQVLAINFNGDFLKRWIPPQGFQRPAGIALNKSGQLLVADAGQGLAYVFDPDGTLVSQVNSKVQPDGRFRRPLSVAFGPNDEILVLDAFSFHVEVQSAQGELLATIGQIGDAPGYLARPKGLAVDRDGHVFISDAAFDNIQVFDMAGNLLMHWGGAGRSAGQFNLPSGLFIDEQMRLFVADSYNHRIQAYQLLY